MKRQDLTQIVGRRDAVAVGRALAADWSWRGRYERPESAPMSNSEIRRRLEKKLAHVGVRYATV